MSVQAPCPEPARLRSLIDSGLSGFEQAEIESHLDSCECCQQAIEALATGDPSWSGVVRHLDDDRPPAPSAYWPALRALERDLGAPPDDGDPDPGDDDHDRAVTLDLTPAVAAPSLDFLAPPEGPGAIGRLDQFDIIGVIGRGGMGIVLHAYDTCLQRDVAIKVLDPKLADNETAQRRFCREARAAAAVTHEHVVGVHYVEEEERSGLPYLVMPLITGESLEERLRKGDRPAVAQVVQIGMQAAAGLAAAHARGLIHRDIKPANILLESGFDRVKLTDFGLARVAEDVRLTRTGFVAGTPLYMSPEQARGEEIDHRSDLFSLGTVLYELCTGRPPFEGNTPLAVLRKLSDDAHRPVRELNPEVPDWLATLIDRLLAKDPAGRIPTAAEVAEQLAHQLSQLRPVSPLEVPAMRGAIARGAPVASGRGRAPGAAAIALAALAGGLVVLAAVGLSRQWAAPARPSAVTADDPGPPSPKPMATLGANAGPIWTAAFAPDGRTLAMGIDDGTVKLWDRDGRRVRGTITAHRAPIWSLAFDPEGARLATGSDDGTVKLWDAASGREQRRLTHPASVRSVAFSPDGRRLVTGGRDGGVRIWDLEGGDEPLATSGHAGVVMAVAVSPDGETAASAGGDKLIKLWDLRTGQERLTLQGHAGGVYAVALSPDRRTVASGGWDKSVRLWDAGTGAPLATLPGHTQDIWAVAFSPDGRRLASAGEDRTVKVWDVAAGRELATLRGHTGALYTVAFSPDGRTLASGGRDGNVLLWDAAALPPPR